MLVALVAAASAGPEDTRAATAKPALVWSISTLVQDFQGRWRENSIVWIGAADGSRARPLAEGRRPGLSPDGRWVAFIRDEHTYVVSSTGGRPWLVTRNADPVRWSPDSRRLATVAHGIALYVTDLGTRRRVTIDRDATIGGASFSPSGEEIVWARQRGREYVAERSSDLFRARVDGTGTTRLTRRGKNVAPVWGSRSIAFGRIRPGRDVHFPIYELWTMQPRGDGLRRLTRTSHVPLELSADGRRLLTSTYRASGAVASVVDVETGRIRQLLRHKDAFPLALSRDGRSVLAWVRRGLDPPNGPYGDLVRVNWNRSQKTLVKNGDQIADWNL